MHTCDSDSSLEMKPASLRRARDIKPRGKLDIFHTIQNYTFTSLHRFSLSMNVDTPRSHLDPIEHEGTLPFSMIFPKPVLRSNLAVEWHSLVEQGCVSQTCKVCQEYCRLTVKTLKAGKALEAC